MITTKKNLFIVLVILSVILSPTIAFAVDPHVRINDIITNQDAPFRITHTNGTVLFEVDHNGKIQIGLIASLDQLPVVTPSRVIVTNGTGFFEVSTITTTLLDFLSGASSNIQTQIDGKLSDLTGESIHTLLNVTNTGCAVGEILKVSGTTWQCASDDDTIGSMDIITEGDSNVEVIDTGTGLIVFVVDGTQIANMTVSQFTTITSLNMTGNNIEEVNTLNFTGTPATTGVINIGNTQAIALKKVASGDWTISIASNDKFHLNSSSTNLIMEINAGNGDIQFREGAEFGWGGTTSMTGDDSGWHVTVPTGEAFDLEAGEFIIDLGFTPFPASFEYTFDTTRLDLRNKNIERVYQFISNSTDPADDPNAVILLGNDQSIAWEQSPSGVDLTIIATATENFEWSTSWNNIDFNSNPLINANLASSTNTFMNLEQLANVTSTGCAVGQILKVSGTTWQCAIDGGGGALDDVFLDGIIVANARNTINFNNTLSGTNQVTFLVSDDAGLDMANVTAQITDNTIIDADLASGVFASITGIGTQTQALDMGTSDIINVEDFFMEKTGDPIIEFYDNADGQVQGSTVGIIDVFTDDANGDKRQMARLDFTVQESAVANFGGGLKIQIVETEALTTYMEFRNADQDDIDILKPVNFNNNPLTNADISSSTNTFPNLEQLNNVTSTGCAVGEILKVSGTTWNCATDVSGAGGALDDVFLDGIIVSNARNTINFNNTLSGTNQVTFLVSDDAGLDMANVTAQITDNTIIDADLASGVFAKITGLGTQSQDMVFGSFDINDLSNLEFSSTTGEPAGTVPYILYESATEGIVFNAPTGDFFTFKNNGVNVLDFDGTFWRFNSNRINELDELIFLGSAQFVSESPSTNDLTLNLLSGGLFEFSIAGVPEVTFDATETDFLGNDLRNIGFLETSTASPPPSGFIRMGNNEFIVAKGSGGTSENILGITASGDTEIEFQSGGKFLIVEGVTDHLILNPSAGTFDITGLDLINADLSSGTNTFMNLEQLANVTSTGCAVGEILKVSGTTWQCATDDDTMASQDIIFEGDSEVEVIDAGAGLIEFVVDGTQVANMTLSQFISIIDFNMTGNDIEEVRTLNFTGTPATSGVINIPNDSSLAFKKSGTGDYELKARAGTDEFQFFSDGNLIWTMEAGGDMFLEENTFFGLSGDGLDTNFSGSLTDFIIAVNNGQVELIMDDTNGFDFSISGGNTVNYDGATWDFDIGGGTTAVIHADLSSTTNVFSNLEQLGNVTSTGCAVGQILKVSGTTWQCAIDGGGGALDDVFLDGIIVANARNTINFNNTLSGTNQVTFLVSDDAGLDMANVTAQITDNTIIDADLASGVFAKITGLGVQTQTLDMSSQIIQFVDSDTTISSVTNDLEYDVSIGDTHRWRINDATILELKAGELDLAIGVPIVFDPASSGLLQIDDDFLQLSTGDGSKKFTWTGAGWELDIPEGTFEWNDKGFNLFDFDLFASPLGSGGFTNFTISVGTDTGTEPVLHLNMERSNGTPLTSRDLLEVSNNDVAQWVIKNNGDVDMLSNSLLNSDLSSATNTFMNLEQLANVTSTGCAVGEILKVSGTTWQCATDDGSSAGALDDVFLDGIIVSNARNTINFNNTLSGTNQVTFLVSDDAGLDMANVTAQITDNTIIDADLASGVFASITGLGVQTQTLDMGNNLLTFGDGDISAKPTPSTDFYNILVETTVTDDSGTEPLMHINLRRDTPSTVVSRDLFEISNNDVAVLTVKQNGELFMVGDITIGGSLFHTDGDTGVNFSASTIDLTVGTGGTKLDITQTEYIFETDAGTQFTIGNSIIDFESNAINNADFSSSTNTFMNLEQLANVTSTGCAVGQILKVSGTTWNCATDAGGALDDVFLDGIIVANARNTINFNNTLSGTNQVTFLVSDDAGLDMANVTAQITDNTIIDADLASGAFASITGLGVQTQALDMGNNNVDVGTGQLQFNDSTETISIQSGDMILDVPTTDIFSFDIAGVPELTIDATNVDFTGQNILNANLASSTNTFPNLEQLNNVTSTGCAVGQILKVSGTTWNCAVDDNTTVSTALTDTGDIAYLNTANVWTTGTQDFGSLTIEGFDLNADGTGNSVTNVDTPDFIGVAQPKLVILTAGGGQLQLTDTCAKNTVDGTNMDYVVCDFDDVTSESAIWTWEVPSNFDSTANIDVVIRFQVNAGTAGVCFDASFLDLTAGDTVDGTFTTVQGACDATTGTNIIETASIAFTSAQHSIDAGDTVYIKIARDVADATDTNTNDARLIDIRVEWS